MGKPGIRWTNYLLGFFLGFWGGSLAIAGGYVSSKYGVSVDFGPYNALVGGTIALLGVWIVISQIRKDLK